MDKATREALDAAIARFGAMSREEKRQVLRRAGVLSDDDRLTVHAGGDAPLALAAVVSDVRGWLRLRGGSMPLQSLLQSLLSAPGPWQRNGADGLTREVLLRLIDDAPDLRCDGDTVRFEPVRAPETV